MVTDRLGLVKEGGWLTVYLRPTNKAFVFRVKTRWNKGYETFNYGALPLESGDSMASYDGGTTSVPADGVIPARAYNSTGKSFPLSGALDETDMWYLTEDYGDRVFHVIQRLTPSFLRVDMQIPKGVSQGRFQRGKKIIGVESDFGFNRGEIETIHLPRMHYGYRWGNDTNMNLYTSVQFTYGEYVIEIPENPNLIFDVLVGKVPSHWVSLPICVYDRAISEALLKIYGIEGFPVYREDEKGKAVSEYAEIIRNLKR